MFLRGFLSCFIVLIMILVLISCSSVNVDELKKLADQAFDQKDYDEFNKHFNKLIKKDKQIAATYLNTVKDKDYFKIEEVNDESELTKRKEEYQQIKGKVIDLADFTDEKIKNIDSKVETIKYKNELDIILDQIVTKQLAYLDDPLNKIYELPILLDSLDEMKEVITSFDNKINDANAIMIELEDLSAPEDKKGSLNNFISSYKDFKNALEDKLNYLQKNKVEIIAYNINFLDGNIFAVEKASEFNGELEKLTSKIKSSATNIKQRVEKLR